MDSQSFSVVALIDALGFKGLEKRMNPAMAIEAMKVARTSMATMTNWMNDTGGYEHFHVLGGKPTVRKSWFSDTICVIVQPPVDEPRENVEYRNGLIDEATSTIALRGLDERGKAALVDIAVECVGNFLRSAATSALPFVFRGVVTVGDTIVDDENIYMGSAIGEASSLYEAADGAFVWLSPGADRLPMSDVGRDHDGLVQYSVPLKDGRSVDTRVVSPFIDTLAVSDLGPSDPSWYRESHGRGPSRHRNQEAEHNALPNASPGRAGGFRCVSPSKGPARFAPTGPGRWNLSPSSATSSFFG
jgi:hypothetical protein